MVLTIGYSICHFGAVGKLLCPGKGAHSYGAQDHLAKSVVTIINQWLKTYSINLFVLRPLIDLCDRSSAPNGKTHRAIEHARLAYCTVTRRHLHFPPKWRSIPQWVFGLFGRGPTSAGGDAALSAPVNGSVAHCKKRPIRVT